MQRMALWKRKHQRNTQSTLPSEMTLRKLPTCAVNVLPAISLFHDCFQIFLPHHFVLNGIFDYSTGQACGDICRFQCAVTKVTSKRQTAIYDRNCFSGAHRSAG